MGNSILLEKLNNKFINDSPQNILNYFLQNSNYKNKIALSSSLSLEDQILTDMVVKINKSVR